MLESLRRTDRQIAAQRVRRRPVGAAEQQRVPLQPLISRTCSGTRRPLSQLRRADHVESTATAFPAARHLRLGSVGLIGGLTLPRLLELEAIAANGRDGQGQGVHLPVPGRRPQHDRHVGPEAGGPGGDSRAVSADRDQRARHVRRRALPLSREDRRQVHDRPLAQPQRQRPHHRLSLLHDRLQSRLRRRPGRRHAEQSALSVARLDRLARARPARQHSRPMSTCPTRWSRAGRASTVRSTRRS